MRECAALGLFASLSESAAGQTTLLPAVFGSLVGLSLGLTGGGGSILAVPLLIYGLGVSPREAVIISLAAVGTTALVGVIVRMRAGEVEVPTGLLFSAGGVLGAPLGTWLGSRLPENLLLVLFAGLMVFVAVRMWRKSGGGPPPELHVGSCRRNHEGKLALGRACVAKLALIGVGTGIFSGLFGVGGGFVIVPALVFFTGMPIRQAVATSLLVIALVGASGVLSVLISGRQLPLGLTAWFVMGGVAGLFAGARLSRRMPAVWLQKGFAAAMLGVALLIVVQRVA